MGRSRGNQAVEEDQGEALGSRSRDEVVEEDRGEAQSTAVLEKTRLKGSSVASPPLIIKSTVVQHSGEDCPFSPVRWVKYKNVASDRRQQQWRGNSSGDEAATEDRGVAVCVCVGGTA